MDLAGGDANLRAEPEAEAIRKARGGIPKDVGGIHAALEEPCCGRIIGDDGVSVMRAIAVDVRDGLRNIIYYFDRQYIIKIFN